jgi:cytochrome b561
MLLKRSIATIELLLIFPASLFMLSLFLRNVQPAPYQPAETARHIVDWFTARPHIGLQLFLITLPLAALVLGIATTLRTWRRDPNLRQVASTTLTTLRSQSSFVLIAASTLLAFAILSIVALHLITD